LQRQPVFLLLIQLLLRDYKEEDDEKEDSEVVHVKSTLVTPQKFTAKLNAMTPITPKLQILPTNTSSSRRKSTPHKVSSTKPQQVISCKTNIQTVT
jgi:hypothetical protein